MRNNAPLITRPLGMALFFFSVLFVLGAFFALADHAELFYAEESAYTIDGLTLQPSDSRWPGQAPAGIVFIIALSAIPVVVGHHLQNRNPFVVGASAAILFGIVSLIALSQEIGVVMVNRPWYSLHTSLLPIGYILLSIVVATLAAVYTWPLLPDEILLTEDNATLERYIAKQGRFAHASLTIGLAAAVGTSIPIYLNSTDFFAPTVLFSALVIFLLPFTTISGFLGYRIHVLERKKRSF